MAQNFNEMTKEELEAVLNGDSIVKMSAAELNTLRKAVKAAGLLTVQYDNMLGIALNNRTYEEIKNSNKYTEEEKALALEARNEYNKELRARTQNKLYNAEEIMSRAVEANGQYHFENLTKGEMDFLLDNGIVRLNQLSIDKQYVIGQEKEVNHAQGSAENLSDDVKKAAKFWTNFNDNKSGIQYIIQALKDNSVKVEAQKDKKTVFTGIDHGNQGFDIVKKENTVEPYAIYDLIIKKAKTSNPKAKIRIKDNVKDSVLRNKILIACAKNNMEPIGNVPEGFDFAALKEMVKDIKDIATINALAENMDNIEVTNQPEQEENKHSVAAVINPGTSEHIVAGKAPEEKQQDEKKEDNKTFVAPLVVNQNGVPQKPTTEKQQDEKKDNKTIVAPLPGLSGNGNSNKVNGTAQTVMPTSTKQEDKKPVEAPKRPWWKKVRDAVVVGGIAILGLIGIRNCQNQDKLQKNIKDLQEQIDKKSMTDCDALSAKFAEEYAKGYNDGKKDCEEQNTPAPKPVVKKKTPAKKTQVKQTPVQNTPIAPSVVQEVKVLSPDTIKGETVYLPADTVKGEPVVVTDTIHKQVVIEEKVPAAEKKVVETTVNNQNSPKKTSAWIHGDMFTNYKFHGDMPEHYEAHEEGENEEKVKTSKKQNVQTAWVLQNKGNVKE